MSGIDPPGTCHLVGCPEKGKHLPHHARRPPLIGAPDSFAPYLQAGLRPPAKVQLEQPDVAAVLDLAYGYARREDLPVLERVQQALAVARNTT